MVRNYLFASSRRMPGPITSVGAVKPRTEQRVTWDASGYGSRHSPGGRGVSGSRFAIWLAALLLALTLPPAFAVQPDEIMTDPVKEARARELSRELRCMVCQNQSIDDSEAPLARDLRLLVRERIAAGDSDAQVMDFLVARYGEFVLLKPRLTQHTLLLWLLPPLALLGGGAALWAYHRRRIRPAEHAQISLSPEEEARLRQLTGAEQAGKS
jgi:cytochrome c-type biogenesis protein CcmH